MSKADLVKIGNSRGIRLPKPIIEQCGFGDTVELHVEGNRVVIAPDRAPRKDWAESFRKKDAGAAEDTPILDDSIPNAFDAAEWEW